MRLPARDASIHHQQGRGRAGALSDWRNWYIGVAMLLTQCGNVALMYFLPLLLRNALYGPDAAPVPPGALTAGDTHAHELVSFLATCCRELVCIGVQGLGMCAE